MKSNSAFIHFSSLADYILIQCLYYQLWYFSKPNSSCPFAGIQCLEMYALNPEVFVEQAVILIHYDATCLVAEEIFPICF